MFLILLAAASEASTQAIDVFHESFEAPAFDDSVTTTQTVPGIKDWNISTRLHYQGSCSDTCRVKNAATTYLTTAAFSTVGYTFVMLEFAQIAKLDFLDNATIEVSSNGGVTWTQLSGAHYLGTGLFGTIGNKFAANSYGLLWQPSTPSAIPQNTWWKLEQFNVSSLIASCANAKVRFKLMDGGVTGPNSNYGWCLDAIKVICGLSELIPPTITLLNTNPSGTVNHAGPFAVKAKVSDASGIDTAYLVYTFDNGIPDTAGMTMVAADTMQAVIPPVTDSVTICYHVVAIDASLSHNAGRNPLTGCNSFLVVPPLVLPWLDNFDGASTAWTTSGTGTIWQRGTPAFGATNTAYSPPNAWDVNLTTACGHNANCALISPVFNLTGSLNPSLSFRLNFKTEASYDGTHLEYTLDGTTWSVLGTVGDPLGSNWYNSAIMGNTLPSWNGNSSGWQLCTYALSQFSNVAWLRFRFVFRSDASGNSDGCSIDDFKITPSGNNEVSLLFIDSPVSGCSLGQETVSLKIKNKGNLPVSGGLTAAYRLDANPVVSQAVPGTIQSGDTLTFTFNLPVNLSAGQADSVFSLKAWVALANDPDPGDDTLTTSIQSKLAPPPPQVVNQSGNYGSTATLTAVSAVPVRWYNAATGGVLLSSQNPFTSPPLFATTVYYVEARSPNGCTSVRVPDTVFVLIPGQDASLLAILTPSSGNYLTGAEAVNIRVCNNGTGAINGFSASYRIDNLPAVTETVNDTILPSDTIACTFVTPADLSTFGYYKIKSWVIAAGDPFHSNDTLIEYVSNQPFSFCASSASSSGDAIDIGRVQLGDLDNGQDYPVIFNDSAIRGYSDFTAAVPPVNLSRGHSYRVSVSPVFSEERYINACKVFADWNHNGLFEVGTETAFTSIAGTFLPYTGLITVPADAYPGEIRLRVVLRQTWDPAGINPCGNYQTGETEDYTALIVDGPVLSDIQPILIQQPPSAYESDSSYSPVVLVKNNGSVAVNAFTLSYKLDNSPAVSLPFTGFLAAGGITSLSFPTVVLPAGLHQLCVYSSCGIDTLPSNDTICQEVYGSLFYTLPMTDSLDGTSYVWQTVTNNPATQWVHGPVQPGGFPTQGAHSPPNVWAVNPGTGSYAANSRCELITQEFPLLAGYQATLTFWFTLMTDTQADGFHIEFSTDGGNTWLMLGTPYSPVWCYCGYHWYPSKKSADGQFGWSGSYPWTYAVHDLGQAGNLDGTVRLKFVFVSDGTGASGGAAIDDLRIYYAPSTDAGISHLVEPSQHLVAGGEVYAAFNLFNFGNSIYGIDAGYQVDNGPVVSQNYIFNFGLEYMEGTNILFTNKFTVPTGDFTLKMFFHTPDDENPGNDTLVVNLHGYYPCQSVDAKLDTALLSPMINPLNYILACPGQQVHFAASGIYNENNTSYFQEDATSVFTWEMGDGTILSGQAVDHSYQSGGTFHVRYKVHDFNLCESPFIDGPLVVINDHPVSAVNPLAADCPGHQQTITIGHSDTNTISLAKVLEPVLLLQLSCQTPGFIPDAGYNVGECYSSVLNVSLFDTGAVITQPEDLAAVCINMEHSYTGDLDITLTCPTGQSVVLKSYVQSGSAYLGVPLGGASHDMYDCSNVPCQYDPLQNPPGAGWTYCFSPAASNPSINAVANMQGSIPAGSYQPSAGFATLAGCPVNGTWSLTVCDHWAIDNGWVFGWNLMFSPDIMAPLTALEPLPDTVIWSGNDILSAGNTMAVIQPSFQGTHPCHVSLVYNTGCVFDTTILVEAVESFQADCGPDLMLQQAGIAGLSVMAPAAVPPLTYQWSTGDNTQLINVFVLSDSSFTVTVTDGTGCSSADTVNVVTGVCPSLSGFFTYDNVANTPLTNTKLKLKQGNAVIDSTITALNGHYLMPALCQPGPYLLAPSCNKTPGGYNAADALKAMNYFVGSTSLGDLQQQAADVDNSGSINAVDALNIMKRFVGMTAAFPVGDWVYEAGDLDIGPYYNVEKDMKTLCTGDVDRSFTPQLKAMPAISQACSDDFLHIRVGENFELPVFTRVPGTFHAISLVLGYDPGLLEILSVVPAPGLTEDGSFLFHISGGECRIAWYSLLTPELIPEMPLLTLTCRMKSDRQPTIRIEGNSMFTGAEGNTLHGSVLLWPGLQISRSLNDLSVFPNPANTDFSVRFRLDEPGEISLWLVNTLGHRICLLSERTLSKGEHTLYFQDTDLNPGLYLLQLYLETGPGLEQRWVMLSICE